MSAAEPTVFIVDDDPAVRKALTRLLRTADYRVEAFEGAEAFLNLYNPQHPGCLLLDVAMPGLDGLALQQRLREADACLPIVFLTGQGDIPASVRAMKGGAVDFLSKPVDDAALFTALREAIGLDAAARLAREGQVLIQRRIASLTPRELEVLRQVVQGKPNKQIATELGIAEKTIKIHRGRVMEKMQARSLAELVRLTEYAGLVSTL